MTLEYLIGSGDIKDSTTWENATLHHKEVDEVSNKQDLVDLILKCKSNDFLYKVQYLADNHGNVIYMIGDEDDTDEKPKIRVRKVTELLEVNIYRIYIEEKEEYFYKDKEIIDSWLIADGWKKTKHNTYTLKISEFGVLLHRSKSNIVIFNDVKSQNKMEFKIKDYRDLQHIIDFLKFYKTC